MIDPNLISAIREGRAVLFLGAGASYGATNGTGGKIPLADELADKISLEFLKEKIAAPFSSTYDYAVTASNIGAVQTFIHQVLDPFGPAPWHLKIPTFRWAGIVTTNYDLVIERAYEQVATPAQSLQPFCADKDDTLERLTEGSLLYIKLHGCITRHQDVKPPMIASTEQIINYKDGRSAQFNKFIEWAQTKVLLFVGYGMADPNLRAIFDFLKKEGENRFKYYFVRPDIKLYETDYWAERRVATVSMTFGDFLAHIDAEITPASRTLALLQSDEETSFTRFIDKPSMRESFRLRAYLEGRIDHVSDRTEAGPGDPKQFYNGFDRGWYAVEHELDVRRVLEHAIVSEQIASTTSTSSPKLSIVKSHAGGGKTVLMRRIAWEAARTLGKVVFFAPDGASIDRDMFAEIVSLTSEPVILVIDDITEGSENVQSLMDWARSNRAPITVIGAARYNEWNVRADHLSSRVQDVYELRYLSTKEIENLLAKLAEHDCLGALAALDPDERKARLTERYGRQLLVALHEATHNKSFEAIIADEYAGIYPPEAQVLYRDVCAINRLGQPVRAGLVARLHGISFDEFSERFFKPLEEVIEARFDGRVQDWVYRARHPQIAEMVYGVSLPTTAQRFENLSQVVSKLNVGYTYDEQVMSALMRGNLLADLFPDRTMGSAIYDIAQANAGSQPFLLHQRGIYEMRLAGDQSALDRAEAYLNEALSDRTNSSSIRHSLSELNFKRASIAVDPIEKEAFRRKSEAQASNLAKGNTTSYAHHTLLKIAIAELRDAMERGALDDELAQEVVGQAIRKAEDVLRTGLQKFPNDDRLLNEQATLNELLEKSERVLPPLRKAFKANPRSELICRRLARVLLAKREIDEAINVLQQGLDFSPGSQSLNFVMAEAIRDLAPDADQSRSQDLIFHLKRSFAEGDRHYEAQFWYARQLTISGEAEKAKGYFSRLKRLALPFEQRRRARGRVLKGDGTPRIFYGQIYRREPTYGFIRTDTSNIECFFRPEVSENDPFQEGVRVRFVLEFTLSGPTAAEIALT